MIVTKAHMRTVPGFRGRSGFCATGSREWARRNGLDFAKFLREGIDARELEAVGDPFALAVVAWARKQTTDKGPGNG